MPSSFFHAQTHAPPPPFAPPLVWQPLPRRGPIAGLAVRGRGGAGVPHHVPAGVGGRVRPGGQLHLLAGNEPGRGALLEVGFHAPLPRLPSTTPGQMRSFCIHMNDVLSASVGEIVI